MMKEILYLKDVLLTITESKIYEYCREPSLGR